MHPFIFRVCIYYAIFHICVVLFFDEYMFYVKFHALLTPITLSASTPTAGAPLTHPTQSSLVWVARPHPLLPRGLPTAPAPGAAGCGVLPQGALAHHAGAEGQN